MDCNYRLCYTRRKVYRVLEESGIDVPPYVTFDKSKEDNCLIELDDMLEVNGRTFHKPFVEKPISAEDHNIYIYFPSDYGGGSQRLFRKVRSRYVYTSHRIARSMTDPVATLKKAPLEKKVPTFMKSLWLQMGQM